MAKCTDPVKEIAATTRKTLLASKVVRIAARYLFMGSVCMRAIMLAQIVQLVSRVKVARVAVGAQIAHIKNTKAVQMKQTAGIAMTAVGTAFRLDVVFYIREIQQDIVEGVMMDNMYTVHGPDHAKIAVRAPGVSTYLDVAVMAQVRERARIVQVVPQASTELDVAAEVQEVAPGAQIATRDTTEVDVVVQVREVVRIVQVVLGASTEMDVVVKVREVAATVRQASTRTIQGLGAAALLEGATWGIIAPAHPQPQMVIV